MEQEQTRIKNTKLTINVGITNMDEYLSKANKYVELLKEAKTLAEELASVKFEIELTKVQS